MNNNNCIIPQACPRYEDINYQGNNFCYTNRNMVLGTGFCQSNHSERHHVDNCAKQLHENSTCAHEGSNHHNNCFMHMQQPCCSYIPCGNNFIQNRGCNSQHTEECGNKKPDCNMPPNVTHAHSNCKNVDRWKTVYQANTDDLGRNLLANRVDCRRKPTYPKRCVLCDACEDAIARECMHPCISKLPDNFENCCDYKKGEKPVGPPPPMRCVNQQKMHQACSNEQYQE